MLPELGGLAKRFLDDRIECDDSPDKLTACRPCIWEFGSRRSRSSDFSDIGFPPTQDKPAVVAMTEIGASSSMLPRDAKVHSQV
jgi:hypothetical protein